MRKTFIAAFALTALTGCMSAPTIEERQNADYGPYPENYQSKITAFMTERLKDPDSAKYQFGAAPRQAWYGLGGTRVFGWATCVGINAKNSYGGYVGMQQNYFLFKDGQIVRDLTGSSAASLASAVCSKL